MSAAPVTHEQQITRTRRLWPTAAAAVVLSACFGLTTGPIGVLAGIATAAVFYTLGTPYAVAVGHVVLVVLVPGGLALLPLLLVESGFVALLLVDATAVPASRAFAGVAVATALGLAGLAGLLVGGLSLWLVATGQLLGLALAAYTIHRVERVQLSLDSTTTLDTPTDSPSADS